MVRKWFRIEWVFALAVVASGCPGEKKYPISGRVTWEGKPVEKGYVAFLAEDGKSSEAVGQIVNGQYSTESLPGAKRVEVYADQSKGFDAVMQQEIRVPLVTSEYNAQTVLRFEVQPGPNTYDLELPPEIQMIIMNEPDRFGEAGPRCRW